MPDLPRVDPFSRIDWTGRLVSLDGTPSHDFTEEDMDRVIAAGDTGGGWDGTAAAVLRLKDGRVVAYETFWGPTGDGFNRDAYGGDADLSFAADVETAVRLGLTIEGRRLCGFPEP